MLNENLKKFRKSKGLSQEELAVRLNVVRQTLSKWENGLSVPDADMLVSISETLETPVSVLLGETIADAPVEDLRAISEKLEIINLQLAERSAAKAKTIRWLLISLCAIAAIVFASLASVHSAYLDWDFKDPELAVAGTLLHGFEWLFMRLAPFVFLASAIGILVTYKKR